MAKSVPQFIHPLPLAIIDESRCAEAKRSIATMEKHILALERQMVFFKLRALLANRFPEVVSFVYEMGSHYNDEGYSDHVILSVVAQNEDGSKTTHEADDEYGSFRREDSVKYETLSEFVGAMPDKILSALSRARIHAQDERALASSVMGAEGFAHFEAASIAAVAQPCSEGGAGAPRL